MIKIVQKKRIGLPHETLSGIPPSGLRVLLYPVGIKTALTPVTSVTIPNYTGVLSFPTTYPTLPWCCPLAALWALHSW